MCVNFYAKVQQRHTHELYLTDILKDVPRHLALHCAVFTWLHLGVSPEGFRKMRLIGKVAGMCDLCEQQWRVMNQVQRPNVSFVYQGLLKIHGS